MATRKTAKRKSLYIPLGREDAVWKAWERLARDVTPDNALGLELKVSSLFTLIGERAIDNPQKVAELVREITKVSEW